MQATRGESPVELNRAIKARLFRRANDAELKFPPLAKLRWLVRRIFWPEAGILVRLRSLGVVILVDKNPHFAQILPASGGITAKILGFRWVFRRNETSGGNSKGTFLW